MQGVSLKKTEIVSDDKKLKVLPVRCVPSGSVGAGIFRFSTAKTIHLYFCQSHPGGVGFVR